MHEGRGGETVGVLKKNKGKKVVESTSKKRRINGSVPYKKVTTSQSNQKKKPQLRSADQQARFTARTKKRHPVAKTVVTKGHGQRTKRGRNTALKKRGTKKVTFSYQAVALIGNLFFYTMTISIIAMALMFSFSSKSTASIFGYRFYTVLTNSMVPQKNGPVGGFFAGDIVIVQMMDGSKAKKQDIVTFSVGDGTRYLTHRIVEKREELNGEQGQFLVTKGDANKSNDPPIEASRVVGKVVTVIPKVGSVLDFIRAEFWACLICVISLYGFFLVIKAYLFTPIPERARGKKRKKRPSYQ